LKKKISGGGGNGTKRKKRVDRNGGNYNYGEKKGTRKKKRI